MASISVLVGGVAGFISFLVAWLALGADPLTAFAVYFMVGIAASASMLALGLRHQARREARRPGFRPEQDSFAAWEQDALADRMVADAAAEREQAKDGDGSSKVA